MTDYRYDVFLSYLHEKPCGTWVIEHFLPYFQPQLGNALNRKASIFFDRTGIHSGQKWSDALKQALALSRCLVGIWTPLYFQSQWCQAECAIMRHRETQLGFATTKNPDGLIVGVKVNDGDHFPPFAKERQYSCFEDYFVDGPGFTNHPTHVDFQRAIVPLSQDVARIVGLAPPWSSDWLTAAWTDDVISRLQTPSPPKVPQPLLI